MEAARYRQEANLRLANIQATLVKVAQRQLAAMKNMCVFRMNGVCWEQCQAREFCRPEAERLQTVRDLREVAS